MKRVKLIGGPLDGKSMTVEDRIAVIADATLKCPDCGEGGAVYTMKPDQAPNMKRLYFSSAACKCGSHGPSLAT